jgi:hypothetical protein
LRRIPKEFSNGPVFVPWDGSVLEFNSKSHVRSRDLVPFNNGHYARRFKAVLRDLELSDELRISNAWSGEITKAKALVDPKTLSHAAQHTQMRQK